MKYDYSASPNANMQHVLMQFLNGLRGERKNPVSCKRIVEYFDGTPAHFIVKELDNLVFKEYVRMFRKGLSRKSGYAYELTDKGRSLFERNRYYNRSAG